MTAAVRGTDPAAPAPGRLPAFEPVLTLAEGASSTGQAHVRLESFDGPLALLLSLIEARRLDVLTVPLGALAGAFLDALQVVEVGRLGSISSFVAMAGQLILIKSRALLPRPPESPVGGEEEGVDPEQDLRERLIDYRRFREAAARLADLGSPVPRSFRREAPGPARQAGLARPIPTVLDPVMLVSALDRLALVVPDPVGPPEVMARTITLADRADFIRAALDEAGLVVLQDLLGDIRDRVVIAVTFLAMLELVKRHEVTIDQAEPWGPIVVRAHRTDGPAE